MFNRSFLLTVS